MLNSCPALAASARSSYEVYARENWLTDEENRRDYSRNRQHRRYRIARCRQSCSESARGSRPGPPPEKAKFPGGVSPVKADLMDIEATRKAIAQASTLFLLNAVTPDELTQALLADLAREAGVAIVYLSVFHADLFTEYPRCRKHGGAHDRGQRSVRDHSAAELLHAERRRHERRDHGAWRLSATDREQRLLSMVDARDIADIAASSL